MHRLQDMTIKQKLVAIIMLTSGVIILSTIMAFIIWEQIDARNHLIEDTQSHAGIIAENCKAALAFSDKQDAIETLAALRVQDSIIFACIYDKEGEVFVEYRRKEMPEKIYPPEPRGSYSAYKDSYLSVFEEIRLDGEVIGTVYLQDDMRKIHDELKRNILMVVILLLLSLTMGYFLSLRLQRVISGPILKLAEKAKVVSEQKDYSVRVSKQSNDEIGLLIDSFNEMLGQIQYRDSALVDSKERLEERVEKRTAELSDANKQLLTNEKKLKQTNHKLGERVKELKCLYGLSQLIEGDDIALEEIFQELAELIPSGWQYPEITAAQITFEGQRFQTNNFRKTAWIQSADIKVYSQKAGSIEVCYLKKRPVIDEGPFLKEERNLVDSIAQALSVAVERKQTEEALKNLNRDLTIAAEKLEESNRELKNFVYIASHDLKEPLRKVSSFGGLLKESFKGKLNEDDQENLDFMIDGANRMSQMIEGLLVYSKVSTKGVPFELVDLNEVVEQLKGMEVAVLLEETGGTVEVPERLPKVEADPVQMRQLLQNLIVNGIKYRREGVKPRIVIGAKPADNGQVKIEVQDNGIGIKQEYYDDVFSMFRRLYSRQKYEGTGIGLAVCKKIVSRHGGQIGVESKPGEGSTFWFILSRTKEMAVL